MSPSNVVLFATEGQRRHPKQIKTNWICPRRKFFDVRRRMWTEEPAKRMIREMPRNPRRTRDDDKSEASPWNWIQSNQFPKRVEVYRMVRWMEGWREEWKNEREERMRRKKGRREEWWKELSKEATSQGCKGYTNGQKNSNKLRNEGKK